MQRWEKVLVSIANLVVLVNYALARFTGNCDWRADLVILVSLMNLLLLLDVALDNAQEKGRR